MESENGIRKQKRIRTFLFYFIKSKPFDSAALGRLIERVDDTGFRDKKEKPKHRSVSHQ